MAIDLCGVFEKREGTRWVCTGEFRCGRRALLCYGMGWDHEVRGLIEAHRPIRVIFGRRLSSPG